MVLGGGYVKSSNNLLSVEKVSAKYNSSSPTNQNVLEKITFSLPIASGIVALIGSNGSGKTTILRVITGQLPIAEGIISLNGINITSEPTHKRKGIGCIFQRALDGMCSSLTIEENLSLMLMDSTPSLLKSLITKKRKEKILACAQKIINSTKSDSGLIAKLQSVLNREPIEFSGGEAQQLCLLALLLQEPPAIIILADEPTLNLDAENRHVCIEMLQSLSKITTVLVATHDKELIKLSSKIIKIEKGRIVS